MVLTLLSSSNGRLKGLAFSADFTDSRSSSGVGLALIPSVWVSKFKGAVSPDICLGRIKAPMVEHFPTGRLDDAHPERNFRSIGFLGTRLTAPNTKA